jgi:hypothetical protein
MPAIIVVVVVATKYITAADDICLISWRRIVRR